MTQSGQGLADLGVLGTGKMGPRLAAMFARAGRKVILASRDPDRAQAIVDDLGIPGLRAGSYACEQCDAPGADFEHVLAELIDF